MIERYKPEGYSTVSPYLVVDGAASTIRFLKDAFDALSIREIRDPGGKIMHAEVRIEESVIMLADSVEGWPPMPSHVHIYVKDVDNSYGRALKAGATMVQEPSKKQDENRRAGVKDAGGTTWWIATKVE